MRNRYLLLFFLLLLLCCMFLGNSKERTFPEIHPPIAHNGVLDLSSWDFERQGTIRLDGEWELYWGRLLGPENFLSRRDIQTDGLMSLPSVWNGYELNGKPLPGDGYATFRLQLKLPPSSTLLSIKTKEAATAYSLWADRTLIAHNGRVASTHADMVPQYLPLLASFSVSGASVQLTMQVSNFYHRNGGAWTSLILGTESQVRRLRESFLSQDVFLAGSLLIMGLYHVGLYAFRRTDFSFLWLGIFCLVLMLRILSGGERLLVYYWSVPWELASKIEYLSFYILPGLFTRFLTSIYPDETPSIFVRSSQALALGFSCIVLISPTKIYSHSVNSYYVITLLTCIGYTLILSRASLKKREGAFAFLLGFLFFTMTVINDILYQSHIIESRDLVPLGGFVFILFQVIILSQRYSKALTAREAAELANKAKSDFLSVMSHELRTPLNGILGYAQILKRHELSASVQELQEGINVIEHSGNHLLKLINEILDLSKIEAGKTELHDDEFAILDVLEGVGALIEVQAQKKGLQFNKEFKGRFPALILADERRLSQVLLNLLGNAVKFTTRGDIIFRVYVLTATGHHFSLGKAQRTVIRFEIDDSGPGIPEEQLGNIFSPFVQLDDHARSGEGSGLGLTISRQLIALMGGQLEVENLQGKGSRFSFELAFAIREAHSVKSSITAERISGYTWSVKRPVRILIVEDLWESRVILSGLLTPLGFELYEAQNGREGIEMASELQPDVILMDLLMPAMDGFEAIRQIRTLRTGAELKIIVISANVLSDTWEHVKELGGNAVLKKPLRFDELLKALKQHLPISWKTTPISEERQAELPKFLDPSEYITPPNDRLENLYHEAKLFQITQFTQELERLVQISEDYRPFVNEMQRLSQNFDWERICKILLHSLASINFLFFCLTPF